MRILAINYSGILLTGGATAVFVHGNRLLAERGHQVAWLTIGAAPAALEMGQPLYSIPEFRAGRPLRKQAGLALGHLFSPAAYAMSKRAAKTFEPDVVHVHNIQGHLSPSVLLPFEQQGIPVVQTLHDYHLLCPAIHFLSHGQVCEACKGRRYYRCLLQRCRKGEWLRSGVAALGAYASDYLYQYDDLIATYIAPGEFMRRKMVEFGYIPQKVICLPNAYFRQIPLPTEAPRTHILYAGRLSHEKGVDLLVHAACGLGVDVLVAGDGPEHPRLEALARQVGAGNVRFLGFQSQEALQALYRRAIAVVLPSRWYENAPLVILEAYAHAAPVVGADLGALPEFIRDGESGYLFAANDVEDLRRVLEKCLHDPQAMRRMGQAACQRVQTLFSPETYAASLERILQAAILQAGEKA